MKNIKEKVSNDEFNGNNNDGLINLEKYMTTKCVANVLATKLTKKELINILEYKERKYNDDSKSNEYNISVKPSLKVKIINKNNEPISNKMKKKIKKYLKKKNILNNVQSKAIEVRIKDNNVIKQEILKQKEHIMDSSHVVLPQKLTEKDVVLSPKC